ncbi:hypothetical protein, conserved [Eimeria praecox]|uniref:Uncharacterized protein n=1 Tax=Eimeria praecox TaxID=51316 RepID=U6H2H3_9EIME|nr:hypothetical protein, conserved [Eimeria praecox]
MDKHKLDVSQVQSYRLVVRNRAGVLLRWWTDERLRFAIGTGYSEPSVPGADEMAHIFKRTRLRAGTETIDARGAIDAAVQAPERAKGESAEVSSKDQKHEEIRLARLQATRSRTLVCFTDKSAFVDELQLADAQRVYIFLLDRKGEIAWCEHEQYSASKEVEIRELLQLPKTESSVLLTRSDTSRCRIMLPSANGTAEDRQD